MKKILVILSSIIIMTFTLAACHHEEGPAEKAGKKVDQSVSSMKESIQKNPTMQKIDKKVDNVIDNKQ